MVRFSLTVVTCGLALVACGLPPEDSGYGKMYLDAPKYVVSAENRLDLSVKVLCDVDPCALPPYATEYCIDAQVVRIKPPADGSEPTDEDIDLVSVGRTCLADLPTAASPRTVTFSTEPLPADTGRISLSLAYSSDDHKPTSISIPIE